MENIQSWKTCKTGKYASGQWLNQFWLTLRNAGKKGSCAANLTPLFVYICLYIYIKVEPQTLSVKLHILHTYSITGVTDNK